MNKSFKKLILVFICSFIIQGCGISVPKYMVYDGLKQKGPSDTAEIEKDYPAFFYCFDKDREKLREEMTYFYDQCLETIFMSLPPDLQDADTIQLGKDISMCRKVAYCAHNQIFFSLESLTEEQKKECLILKRNLIDLPKEGTTIEKSPSSTMGI